MQTTDLDRFVELISVSEAKDLIALNSFPLSPSRITLDQAAGMVLAEDVPAVCDIPAYPQSSMDGYAISYRGWKDNGRLRIEGESAAGNRESIELKPAQAMRIFTGAAVPPGADTVVIQEKSAAVQGELTIHDEKLAAGDNVRPRGSEIGTGETAMFKGSLLSPPAVGFLSGLGITHVNVYPNPVVSIIVTGNELQDPGKVLHYGQVYESNSHALRAALRPWHRNEVRVFRSEDKLDTLTGVLGKALEESDLVLLTGGVSVGDYDFTLKAADRCGVKGVFHKIRQKPGKPIFFGTLGHKLVFGLPGNPASVLTCFYEYVTVALQKNTMRKAELQKVSAPLSSAYKKPAGLTHFLKGHYDGISATPLDAQESYRLRSFARSNCLIILDEEITECKKGENVEVHLLPS